MKATSAYNNHGSTANLSVKWIVAKATFECLEKELETALIENIFYSLDLKGAVVDVSNTDSDIA